MTKPGGMSYARSLLEKYGWTEGKGLGKTETGMVEALKPKLKFDNTGIGHDHAEQFTFNWWELAFNKAASRVSVKTSGTGEIEEQATGADDLIITTKKPWIAKLMKDKSLEYGSFVKTETLTSEGKVIPEETKLIPSEDECASHMACTSNLSDEELLRICGGRTAHKAARHGHKLVGKLARVIDQEKRLLSTKQGTPAEVPPDTAESVDFIPNGNARKLKKKKKEMELVEMVPQNCMESADGSGESSRKRKEKFCSPSSECDYDKIYASGESKRKIKRGGSCQLSSNGCVISEKRSKKKKKKHSRREITVLVCDNDENQTSEVVENNDESNTKKRKKKRKRDRNPDL